MAETHSVYNDSNTVNYSQYFDSVYFFFFFFLIYISTDVNNDRRGSRTIGVPQTSINGHPDNEQANYQKHVLVSVKWFQICMEIAVSHLLRRAICIMKINR